MSNRIPSALKWLVEKRRRIHSEIIHIETELGTLLELQQKQLAKLQADLDAIDKTIKLHEIIIDPEKISPIRIYQKKNGFKYGKMTRLIYIFLSEVAPDGLSTTQIVELMISKNVLIYKTTLAIETYLNELAIDSKTFITATR